MFLGGKEVRAHYFGRGHTNGDAVIYFPELADDPYGRSDGGHQPADRLSRRRQPGGMDEDARQRDEAGISIR